MGRRLFGASVRGGCWRWCGVLGQRPCRGTVTGTGGLLRGRGTRRRERGVVRQRPCRATVTGTGGGGRLQVAGDGEEVEGRFAGGLGEAVADAEAVGGGLHLFAEALLDAEQDAE